MHRQRLHTAAAYGSRVWAAIVLVGLSLVIAPAGMATASAHDGHHTHAAAVVADPHDALSVVHPHFDHDDNLCGPGDFTDALGLRSRTGLLAVGVIASLIVLLVVSPEREAARGRAPPRTSLFSTTGRDLLNRLCVDRC